MSLTARRIYLCLFALLALIFLADIVTGWSHQRTPPFTFDPAQPFHLIIGGKSPGYGIHSKNVVDYYREFTSIDEAGLLTNEQAKLKRELRLDLSERKAFGDALQACRVSRLLPSYPTNGQDGLYAILWLRQGGHEKTVIVFSEAPGIGTARYALIDKIRAALRNENCVTKDTDPEAFAQNVYAIENAMERTWQRVSPFYPEVAPRNPHFWFKSIGDKVRSFFF